MRKSQDVYRMSYEKLSKHVSELKYAIINNQESLAVALNALEQIRFNINFEMENTKSELNVTAKEWGI